MQGGNGQTLLRVQVRYIADNTHHTITIANGVVCPEGGLILTTAGGALKEKVMNEYILYTLAQVATTLAGFSGLVVVFRVRGAQAWSRAELRIFWFLLGDSFLVLFFSLLPVPLALANWSQDAVWGLCNALLGSWFIVGDVLAFLGERKDRMLHKAAIVPVITPVLFGMSVIAPLMAVALWLSAFDYIVTTGSGDLRARLNHATYVCRPRVSVFHRPDVTARPAPTGARRGTESRLIRGVAYRISGDGMSEGNPQRC